MVPEPWIEIASLSAGFERRVVLRDLTLALPRTGILGLMGPAGVGKSTLLRTLARWNEALPSFWYEGDVRIEGRSLLRDLPLAEAQARVTLLAQKARLFTASVLDNVTCDSLPIGAPEGSREERRERARAILAPFGLWEEMSPRLDLPISHLSIAEQRRLTIARLAAGGFSCLLADEPLRDIPEGDAERIAEMLRSVARERSVLLVTHNQREAKALCRRVALLAAGELVEERETEAFFSAPRTALAQDYVRFGNCWPQGPESTAGEDSGTAPDTAPAEAAPEPPPHLPPPIEVYPMPGGFHWVLPGQLGGMQRPGLLHSKEEDLRALRALGCKVLVNLTRRPADRSELETYGLEAVDAPIADMGVPTLEEAESLVSRIAGWHSAGRPTVLHCKAGLGRTGTMLACYLVFQGENAVRAVGRVRSVNPHAIQNEEQLSFVHTFEKHLRPPEGGR